MINAGSIEQVEVMKGTARRCMVRSHGRVVSMVSRQSKGDIRGQQTCRMDSLIPKPSSGRAETLPNPQISITPISLINAGDFKMGSEVRPLTGYEYESHSVLGGLDINNEWRLVENGQIAGAGRKVLQVIWLMAPMPGKKQMANPIATFA